MPERLIAELRRLIAVIAQASGFGSVTLVVERGRVVRLEWSVSQKVDSAGE